MHLPDRSGKSITDSQVIELLGRNRLVDELLLAGLEVALPARDRGVDLIAYADLDETLGTFVARPIQMKASSGEGFRLDRKYERFPDLLLAFVWHLQTPDEAVTFALSYAEALAIADELGWTRTASWARGAYGTTRPSARIRRLLEPHRMTASRWRGKVLGTADPLSP